MSRVALLYSYLHKNICLFSTIFHKFYMHNYETFYCMHNLSSKTKTEKGTYHIGASYLFEKSQDIVIHI